MDAARLVMKAARTRGRQRCRGRCSIKSLRQRRCSSRKPSRSVRAGCVLAAGLHVGQPAFRKCGRKRVPGSAVPKPAPRRTRRKSPPARWRRRGRSKRQRPPWYRRMQRPSTSRQRTLSLGRPGESKARKVSGTLCRPCCHAACTAAFRRIYAYQSVRPVASRLMQQRAGVGPRWVAAHLLSTPSHASSAQSRV